jgi:hypothetical protein
VEVAIQTGETTLLVPTATQLEAPHAIPAPPPPENGLLEDAVHDIPSVDFAMQTGPKVIPTASQ